jgi:hypothetical protein
VPRTTPKPSPPEEPALPPPPLLPPLPEIRTSEPWFQLVTTALSCLSVIFAAAAFLIATG